MNDQQKHEHQCKYSFYNRRINRLTVEIEQQAENLYKKRQKLNLLYYWQQGRRMK